MTYVNDSRASLRQTAPLDLISHNDAQGGRLNAGRGAYTMIAWICDVNGVLVDTVAVSRAAFAATAAESGLAFGEREYRQVKDLSLLDGYRSLDARGKPSALVERHVKYVRDRLREVRAYPHVSETLAAAKAKGIRVGAATSHGGTAEACLVHTGLYHYIDCLVTLEEVKRPKPCPDAILQVLRLLCVEPRHRDDESVIYIGDSRLDIEAGRAAGVRTIGVTYGVSSHDEIRAARPDYLIESFREMRRFVMVPGQLSLPAELRCQVQRIREQDIGLPR